MDIFLEILQLPVGIILDSQFVLDLIQHLQNTGQFMFREETDLQVEVCATIRLGAQAVLTDQDN